MSTSTDIGPVSKANASAYDLLRIHDVCMMAGGKRALVANFNAAIGTARTVASVRWRACDGYIAIMENARIQDDNRSSAVDLTANAIGESLIRCEATLDNGEICVQPFHIDVSGYPYFTPATTTVGQLELDA